MTTDITTTEERVAYLRLQLESGKLDWPSCNAIAFLLAELDAARQHNEALETVLAQHNDFGALFQPGGRFYEEANLTLGSSAVRAGGAWLVEQLDAARARERHALVAGAEALRRIAAATPIGHEDVTKGPSTYTWLCYAASLLMAEAATTPATPLEQELITMRAREAKIRDAATALRIDANRLCDRNLGGTYEEDCRRSIAALDAALAEGEDTRG